MKRLMLIFALLGTLLLAACDGVDEITTTERTTTQGITTTATDTDLTDTNETTNPTTT